MKNLVLFFSGLLIMAASQAQIPTDGLVGWWSFNGNANDESGSGNDGTVNGAVLTTDRFGYDNSAYYFDGISAYIACTDALIPANDQSRTFTFWVNYNTCLDPPPWYGWGTALSYGIENTNNICDALLGDDGRLCFHLGAYSVPEDILGEWHFIVMVYEKQTDSVRFFINSNLNSSVYLDLPPNTILSGQLFFGQRVVNEGAFYHLNGKLDDIRIYNRALNQDEILALYNEVPCDPMPTIAKAGPNQVVMYDTTTFLQGNTPVEGTGLWTIVSGVNGTIVDPSIPTSTFHGPKNHSYTLRWTITNECGASCDDGAISFMPDIPFEGLVAYYPFNGNAFDESGNGNDGTVNGAILSTDRFGQSNSAYNFNGISDWIYVKNSNSLNINGDVPLTICAWTMATNVNIANYQAIVAKWGPGYNEDDQYLFFLSESKYWFGLSEEYTFTPSLTNVKEDEWVFIVGVYDNITQLIKLFVNGNPDNSIPLTFTIWNTPQFIEIGRYSGGNFFNGKIDNVCIYNRALSGDEIHNMYHEGGWAINATIISTIENQQICKNDSTAFEVKADGIPPLYYQWQKDGADIIGATDSVLTIPQVQPEDAGEYRCIATNEYGADTSNAALLKVEFAVPTYILGDSTVTLFQVATYSVDASAGHSYEFMVEGGIKVDGTDNSITVHWNTAGMGYVKLIEMSELLCYADTNTLEVNIGYSGIDDQEAQHLSVYPNPSSDAIAFYYALDEPSQVTLQIYNLYGQQMGILINENQQKGNHQFSWDVAGLLSGIYFYRLSTGKQSYTGKMTVAR
jgi:hypothetical protein